MHLQRPVHNSDVECHDRNFDCQAEEHFSLKGESCGQLYTIAELFVIVSGENPNVHAVCYLYSAYETSLLCID